jgi:hypothetical protein
MWLSWLDNRTLFACQILLTMVYSLAFLGMRRMYRHLPGTGSFALGFFSGFLACILIVLRGGVPNSVAVVVEQSLIFSAFVLFYHGILLFFRSPRTTRFLSIMCVVALLLLTYFSAVEDRVAARIAIVSFVLLVSRGQTAVDPECLRGADGSLRVIWCGPGDRDFSAWPSVRFHADQPISDTVAGGEPSIHLHYRFVLSADAEQ